MCCTFSLEVLKYKDLLSHLVRKLVFGVSYHVHSKLVFKATEENLKLEILVVHRREIVPSM